MPLIVKSRATKLLLLRRLTVRNNEEEGVNPDYSGTEPQRYRYEHLMSSL